MMFCDIGGCGQSQITRVRFLSMPLPRYVLSVGPTTDCRPPEYSYKREVLVNPMVVVDDELQLTVNEETAIDQHTATITLREQSAGESPAATGARMLRPMTRNPIELMPSACESGCLMRHLEPVDHYSQMQPSFDRLSTGVTAMSTVPNSCSSTAVHMEILKARTRPVTESFQSLLQPLDSIVHFDIAASVNRGIAFVRNCSFVGDGFPTVFTFCLICDCMFLCRDVLDFIIQFAHNCRWHLNAQEGRVSFAELRLKAQQPVFAVFMIGKSI